MKEELWHLCTNSLEHVDAGQDEVKTNREHKPVEIHAKVNLYMVPYSIDARSNERNRCQRPGTVKRLCVESDIVAKRWSLEHNVEQAGVYVEEARESMTEEDDLDTKVEMAATAA